MQLTELEKLKLENLQLKYERLEAQMSHLRQANAEVRKEIEDRLDISFDHYNINQATGEIEEKQQ